MVQKYNNPIYITQPLMPEKDDLISALNTLYNSHILTNMGSFHQELENKLSDFIDVKNLFLFNNGTIALITALKALDLPIGSEVITTPFTFSATPHSILWNGLKPVFCDIEPKSMTIDPNRVSDLITENTSAILPVHVYGFPSDVKSIDEIAREKDLKVIYDGAHAFSTKVFNESICNWGDMTVLSFHATKLFNTIEGGAIVFNDPNLRHRISNLRNFGIRDEFTVEDVGINGKMNEIQSIFGLLNLKKVKEEQNKRSIVKNIYIDRLSTVEDIRIPMIPDYCSNSYQYFPILIKKERDKVYIGLRERNIFARKYFFPPCTEYGCYKGYGNRDTLPVTYKIADEVLCLPFYGELGYDLTNFICDAIIEILQKK